jgi:NADH-quinone oxidoreductase subunit A
MISSLGYVAAFLIAGIFFLALILFIAKLIRPNRPSDEKLTTYESGEQPVGDANVRFNPRFYLYALLFVLFEIELILLFPWAVVFGDQEFNQVSSAWKSYALTEMLIFIGILGLGLAFAWVKGYLNWEKPALQKDAYKSPVPAEQYKKFT